MWTPLSLSWLGLVHAGVLLVGGGRLINEQKHPNNQFLVLGQGVSDLHGVQLWPFTSYKY